MAFRDRLIVNEAAGMVLKFCIEPQDILKLALNSRVGAQISSSQIRIVRSASCPRVPISPDRPSIDVGVVRAPALKT